MRRKNIRRAAGVALLLLLTATAGATCLPAGSPNADTIVCSGTDTTGVASGNGSDSVTVVTGAQVDVQGTAPTVSVAAIDTGNQDDSVINAGGISASLTTDTAAIDALILSGFTGTHNPYAIGIDLGNDNDSLENQGVLTVLATLNASSHISTSSLAAFHDTTPAPISITAIGVVGGNGQDVLLNSGNVSVTAQDNSGANAALAIGIDSGNGKDVITNDGTLTVSATSTQPTPVVTTTTLKAGTKPTSSPASVTAIGIDAGNAVDATINNNAALTVSSSADWSALQVLAQGIRSGNGKDTIVNDGSITVTAETSSADVSVTASLTGGDDLTATTSYNTLAIGIDSGNGGDTVTNNGSLVSQATSALTSFNAELNLVDTSHADTSVSLVSSALGITTGNAKDSVINNGTLAANATSRLGTVNIEVNGADAGLADSANLLDATAQALGTGAGNDTIRSDGAIMATATSSMLEVGVNVSYLDVTIADREGSDTSSQLYSTSNAIDSGSGNDSIYIGNTGSLATTALSNVHSVGVSIASEGVPSSTESLFLHGSLANVGLESFSDATGVISGQGNDDLTNLGSVTANATANSSQVGVNVGIAIFDFVIPTPGLVLGGGGTAADAASIGFDLGQGQDQVNNTGSLTVAATSDASATIVSVNLAELSIGGLDAVPGLGAAVVAADTTTSATSSALGITGGDGNDVIENAGSLSVTADAHGKSTSASAGLGIQIKEGDDALQIDAILARAITQSTANATGISGDDGRDQITNHNMMTVSSEAETDALAIGIDITGTLKASGGAIGATLTDTSSTSNASAVGIAGGDSNDNIANSGTLNVTATADTSSINVSTAMGYVQKGLVAGVSLGRAETEGTANATGIAGGDGLDQITNDGVLNVNAKSDADSVAVSVTLGGTSQGLAAGAALADGGATATANATGITSDGSKDHHHACDLQQKSYSGGGQSCDGGKDGHAKDTPEIVNNNAIVVDAQANTHGTAVAADMQITKEGVAIGAALADNSARAYATSIGIAADDLDNTIVNDGDVQLLSNAFAQAVSVGVTVQGTATGLAAGAALTDASVNAEARAIGMQTGAGNDVLINTGNIHTGSATEQQVKSTATAIGVSTSVLISETGASLGAALADTDATAKTFLTALDGEQGNDELINAGTIDLQNAGANADAVSVSLDVAISQTGLAGGAALANGDSVAELTALGLSGADGNDVLVNKNSIGLRNLSADADTVSVSLTIAGSESGVSLGAALADATANASIYAIGLSGGEDADVLVNKGSIGIDNINADTTAVSVSVGFAASQNGLSIGAGLTDASGHANANVTGMEGGRGDDYLHSSDTIAISNVTSDGHATGVSVALAGTDAGVAAGVTLANTGATAAAHVKGMSGGRGEDTLDNDAAITIQHVNSIADAKSVGISLAAAISGGVAGGAALSDATTNANAFVTGLDGGKDDDKIFNSGSIGIDDVVSNTDSTSVSVELGVTSAGLAVGAALVDTHATSTTDVKGLDGGKGDDFIKNKNSMALTNLVADANAVSVGVTLNATPTAGVAAGVALTDASGNANLYVTGMDGGEGNDKLFNRGSITSSGLHADAHATGVSLAVQASAMGAAAGASVANTSGTATAIVKGMFGGDGNDLLVNQDTIDLQGKSEADATSIGITISVAVGLGGGVTITDASTNANSFVAGMDGGAGLDDMVNAGTLDVTSDAVAESTSASISIGVAIGGDVNLADARSTASATAVGMYDPAEVKDDKHCGGGSHDQYKSQHDCSDAKHHDELPPGKLSNDGAITAIANASSKGLTINVDISPFGYGMGETTNMSTADAAGIRFLQGPVLIDNTGNIIANSQATATGLSVTVTLLGAALGDTNTTASAFATGIESGDGNDQIQNRTQQTEGPSINVDARSYASGESIAVAGVGAPMVDLSNTANVYATGINSGAGDDVVLNAAEMYIAAGNPLAATGIANCSSGSDGACAKSFGVSATLAGYGSVDASSVANAVAVGIAAGEGDDRVQSDQTITTMSLARSRAEGINVMLAGANDTVANTTANASATGLAGDAGRDKLINNSNLNVDSGAETYAKGLSIALFGATSASANTTTNASAVGMDGGADSDRIYNQETGHIDVSARTTSEANASSWAFAGVATATTTLGASTSASGITGGSGGDTIGNLGVIEVQTKSSLSATGGAKAILGNVKSGSGILAETFASGIDGGNNNDTIVNNQLIDITTDATMFSNKSSFSFAGSAATDELITASNDTVGILGGEGDDWIANRGELRIDALSKNRSMGGANAALAGNVYVSGRIAADVTAVGIDSGLDQEHVSNAGDINLSATVQSWATHDSSAGVFYSNSGTIADVVARMTAQGVSLGDGDSSIENTGNIDITTSSGDADWDGNGSPEGVFARAKADGGDFDIFGGKGDASASATALANLIQAGISAGNGDNWIVNQGAITVKHSDTAGFKVTAVSIPTAGSFTTSGDSTGVAAAYAGQINEGPSDDDIQIMGIVVGDGENDIINGGEITAMANPESYAATSVVGTGVGNAAGNVLAEVSLRTAGIHAGDGDNQIRNTEDGLITVTASPAADSYINTDAGNLIFIGSDADSTAIGSSLVNAFVAGIRAGQGDNHILNEGGITITAQPSANASVNSHGGPGSENLANAQSSARGDAAGIGLGDGENWIKNTGHITATANATATGSSTSSRDSCAICGGDNTVLADISAIAHSAAIETGQGDDWLINKGELIANAVAQADLNWGGDGDNNPRHAKANAGAYGINSGNGNNYVLNKGLIDVTSTASATKNNASQAVTSTAVGIKTGDGNDEIINYGTINTAQTANGVTSSGTAIDAGGGDDQVILGDGSITNGDIDLGSGSDTLSMEGTPIVNGSILDGLSSLTLAFNNSGSYAGSLAGYRAVKNGTGTFSLSTLPQMVYLEMNQGTLQLNNDYDFDEQGTFQATVYGDGSRGQFMVNGTAALHGQINIARGHGAYRDGTSYDVLTARDGFAQGGGFNAITLPADKPLLHFELQQTGNSMQVSSAVKSFTTVAAPGNAMAVARNLDRVLPAVSGELSDALGEVQGLSRAQEFADAYYKLSPAAYQPYSLASISSSQQYFNAISARMSDLHFSEVAASKRGLPAKPFNLAANGAPRGLFQPSGQDYKYGVFLRGFGQHGVQDTTATSAGYDFTINGIIFGYDQKLSSKLVGGISIGRAKNDLTADQDASAGDIDTTMLSLYGSYQSDRAYLDAALAYGNNSYSTTRNVSIGGTPTDVSSSHDGKLLSLGIAGGLYYPWGNWWWRPYASLQYTSLDEDGFTESGGGASLNVNARTSSALVSQLGINLLRDYQVSSGNVTGEFELAWIHDFDIDDHAISASYVGAPDATFSIDGQKVEQNGIVAGVGFRYQAKSGYITTIKLKSEFRDHYNANSVIGEFRYQF